MIMRAEELGLISTEQTRLWVNRTRQGWHPSSIGAMPSTVLSMPLAA